MLFRSRFGPALVDVGVSGHLVTDGEYARGFDLGKLPPTIVTDWAAPLLDGDLPLDVSIDIEPLELAWAKPPPDELGSRSPTKKTLPDSLVELPWIR